MSRTSQLKVPPGKQKGASGSHIAPQTSRNRDSKADADDADILKPSSTLQDKHIALQRKIQENPVTRERVYDKSQMVPKEKVVKRKPKKRNAEMTTDDEARQRIKNIMGDFCDTISDSSVSSVSSSGIDRLLDKELQAAVEATSDIEETLAHDSELQELFRKYNISVSSQSHDGANEN